MRALRLTGRGTGVLVAAAVAVAAGWLAGSYVLAAGGIFAAALVAVSALRGLLRRRGCRIERVGQPLTARIAEPIAARAVVRQAGPGSMVGLVRALTPEWAQGPRPARVAAAVRLAPGSTTLEQSFGAATRGVFTWPAPVVELPDLFGTVHGVVTGAPGGATVVFPEVLRLGDARMPVPATLHAVVDDGDLPVRIPIGADDGNPVPRAYRSGDDMRRMHWPATARTGEPMVRSEQGQPIRRIAVVLDCRADSHPSGESFERAVVAAASIGVWFIDRGWQVSLRTTSGGPLTTPGWQHGLVGRVQLLTALASVSLGAAARGGQLPEPTDAVCAVLGSQPLEGPHANPWLAVRTAPPQQAEPGPQGQVELRWDEGMDLGALWESAVASRSAA